MISAWGLAGAAAVVGASARWNWWRRSASGVPILMYHKIGSPPAGSKLKKLWVSADRFRWQMDYLKRRGFSTVNVRDLPLDGSRPGGAAPLPPRPVALTFDDGYRNNVEHAAPILKEFGFKATVFLVVNAMGCDNFWHDPKTETRLPMLSWDEVRRLRDAGWEIGSHTLGHPRLTRITAGEVRRELVESRRRIEEEVGEAPSSFAHPYGDGADSPDVRRALQESGYRSACTVHRGWADPSGDPYGLKRVFVRGDDTRWDFHLNMTRGQSRL